MARLSWLIILVSCASVFAQPNPPQEWERTIGGDSTDRACGVVETADGGYLIAAETNSFGAGGADVWVIKLDNQGGTIWQRTYGGPYHEGPVSLHPTRDGNFVIGGYAQTYSGGPLNTHLLKISPTGAPLLDIVYSVAGDEVAYDVRATADGGFVMTGLTTAAGGNLQIVLRKTDGQGNPQWTRHPTVSSSDIGRAVVQTADGGYVIAGSTTDGGLVIKTNSSGIVQWQHVSYGLTSYITLYNICQMKSGDLVACGQVSTASREDEIYMIKLSPAGIVRWTMRHEGGYRAWANMVQEVSPNSLVLCGASPMWLMCFDTLGNFRWEETYVSGREATAFTQTSDGAYLIVGNNGYFWDTYVDVYAVKTGAERTNDVHDNEAGVPRAIALAAFPNPFNASTILTFEVPRTTNVTLKIYDLLGRERAKLMDEERTAGSYRVRLDGGTLASGLYFARLEAGGEIRSEKLVLLK